MNNKTYHSSLVTNSSDISVNTLLYQPQLFKDKVPSDPLTLENVARIQTADPSNTPLARYRVSLAPKRRKSNWKRESRDDSVVESPRIVPFPYHNDSFFLPTAEHDRPSRSIDTESLYTYESQVSRSANSCRKYSPQPQKRTWSNRATPEPLFHDRVVPQKKHRSSNTKFNFMLLFTEPIQRNGANKKASWVEKLKHIFKPSF